jgi:hypothetical protein
VEVPKDNLLETHYFLTTSEIKQEQNNKNSAGADLVFNKGNF